MKNTYVIPALVTYFICKAWASDDQDVQNQPSLCNLDGIQSEIAKAINLLKRKQERAIANNPNLLRQEDDDDDVPYYVPAIAKVIGSVLAQNATNVIEESFGFIPPEVNKNIRYVLGLVADTVEKLRPTPASTTPPIVDTTTVSNSEQVSAENGTGTDSKAISDIEALLVYALAQQIGTNSSISDLGTTANPLAVSTDIPEAIVASTTTKSVVAAVASDVEGVSTTSPAQSSAQSSASELFSSTFKYSNIEQASGVVSSSADELAVYAPAYAPNYGVTTTTTKSPLYAPAFDHHNHKYVTSPQPPSNSTSVDELKEGSTSEGEVSTTEVDISSGTTEDDEDESAGINATSVAPGTVSTTEDEDEEYDEDDNRRAL